MPASIGIWRGHAGFATETVYGTTVIASASFTYIPAMSYDEYLDERGIVLDDAYRAAPSKVFQTYTGMQQGKVALTLPYYPNQVARFFPKLMGTDTIASATAAQGSSAAWTHTFTANSSATPTSDTVTWFYGSTALGDRAFSGLQWQGMDFKFSRASGFATAKITGIGAAPSTLNQGSEFSPTYSSDPALRGWQAVFALGGTTQIQLIDFELNMTREVELVFAANNSQRPAFAEVGALDAKGKMKVYGSTASLTATDPMISYFSNVQQAMDLLLIDTVGGTTVNRIEISAARCVFTKVTPDFGGKFLTYDIEYQLVHNTSAGGDSGPFTAIATVATTSSYIA